MSITARVLGQAGRDNAAFVRVQTRRRNVRFLFDCGDGCAAEVPLADLQAVDQLCFSHLHMDHIGGFDTFFRATFAREARPMTVWGPPATGAILHHRFQGFLWNLIDQQRGAWLVNDVYPDRLATARFETAEAFATRRDLGTISCDGALIADDAFSLTALTMDHHTPSLAYILRESDRLNVNTDRLATLGLAPGPWLQAVKQPHSDEPPTIAIDGVERDLAALRRDLLVTAPGDSFAYLTDFLLDDGAAARLLPHLRDCGTIVCECQFRDEDAALALRHHHMHPTPVAALARDAGAGELILFHLSERYRADDWRAMLRAARAIFPVTRFPDHWRLDG